MAMCSIYRSQEIERVNNIRYYTLAILKSQNQINFTLYPLQTY